MTTRDSAHPFQDLRDEDKITDLLEMSENLMNRFAELREEILNHRISWARTLHPSRFRDIEETFSELVSRSSEVQRALTGMTGFVSAEIFNQDKTTKHEKEMYQHLRDNGEWKKRLEQLSTMQEGTASLINAKRNELNTRRTILVSSIAVAVSLISLYL